MRSPVPRFRTPEPARGVAPDRAGNRILAAGAILYAVLVLFASRRPGAEAWGLSLPGFLPDPLRALVLGLLGLSAALITIAAFREPGPPSAPGGKAPSSRPPRRGAWTLGLLVPLAAILWLLRTRTHFLGDGVIWLGRVTSQEYLSDNEPLSSWIWHGFAELLRSLHMPPGAAAISTLSIGCGLLAAVLLAAIARRLASPRGSWPIPFALLLTLGIAQFYFCYIESYPVVSVLFLTYLWLALRRLDGLDSPWLIALWLPVVVVGHMSALYLIPSYLYLVWREPAPPSRRALYLGVPAFGVAVLLVALSYPLSHLTQPLVSALSGFRRDTTVWIAHRPYGFFSLRHATDVANAVLLAMPVSALLAVRFLVSSRRRAEARSPRIRFLALAGIPGLLIVMSLMTPVAPAQDWDLSAMLLLPVSLLGIALGGWGGAHAPQRGTAIGLVGLSLGALLSLVLVNANEKAGIKRFALVTSSPERVSRQGRAYASSLIEQFYRERERHAEALPYARATLAAEPDNPRFWINLGIDLLALDRADEALPFLEGAVERSPNRWEGRYGLGRCYMRQGRYVEAVEELRAAVRLEGSRPEIRHDLGEALHRAGDTDSAVTVWREILVRWPGYAARLRPSAP